MNKTVRIVLYILSILTVVGVFAAFVFAGKGADKPVMTQDANQTSEQQASEQTNSNQQTTG